MVSGQSQESPAQAAGQDPRKHSGFQLKGDKSYSSHANLSKPLPHPFPSLAVLF